MGHALALVVEDEPEVSRLISAHLKRLGLEVVAKLDAKESIAWLAEHTPDVVCLDLILPDASGYELCDHIRRTPRLGQVPIVVVSGRTLPTDRAEALEAGASAYVTKPFTRATLTAAVRASLPPDPEEDAS